MQMCTSCSLRSLRCARKDFLAREDSRRDTRSCDRSEGKWEKRVRLNMFKRDNDYKILNRNNYIKFVF